MEFRIDDFNEYLGELIMSTEDSFCTAYVDVSDGWDDDAEEWNEDAIRLSAEKAVKERFGSSAIILWE